jgi:Zn-dependent protease
MSFAINKLLVLGVVCISLTVHELSHGWVAYQLGDDTAKARGRLSLNPLKHIDPIGLLMLLVANFGWAKPVPVDPRNFQKVDQQTGMLLTALAGPMSNIVLTFLGVMLMSGLPAAFWSNHVYLLAFMYIFITLNANLAFFNLLPVPPLDGSKILFGILPKRFYGLLYQLERYGGVLLIILIISNITELIIFPLSQGIVAAFFDLAGFIFN